ncbi:MAG: AraC family transcriptional regulator [Paenibacillus sp.]|nr:AraC family transcriptional regulator [Paenibacillus sp.]
MSKPRAQPMPVPLEYVNLEVPIGGLLFDILLDITLLPIQVAKPQPIHNHSVYELHKIISGSGTLLINDKELPVEEGHIYLIGPTVYHSIKPHEGKPFIHSSIRFAYRTVAKPDAWFPVVEADAIKKAFSNVVHHRLSNEAGCSIVSRLPEDMQAEVCAPRIGAFVSIQGLFAQLIAQLIRSLVEEDKHGTLQELPSKVKDELRSRIIDRFFSTNFREPLTLEALASELHLSVKQVNRMLLESRVEEAKSLLRASDLSIQRIAEEIGYASSDNLCRVFIKKVGMTPTEFRKSYKSRQNKPTSDPRP